MGKFIESLESRQLFSTAPAVATLAVDARIVLADYAALKSTGHSNFAEIETELKNAGELKASARALKALGTHATAAESSLSKNINRVGKLLIADVNKLVAAAGKLSKKPTSAPLLKAENTVVAKLRKDASAGLISINTAITNVANTDKTYADQIFSLNSGDSNLKAVFTQTGDSSSAARTTLGNAATTVLTTDVQAVISALTVTG